jgi:chromosome segregation ATPase
MFFGLLVLLTALSISAIAIYYSVVGLVAIFAAATVPIIIMGSALEIGKLVTAVWLHRYWHKSVWWMRLYLSTAVLVLMFITSMGIFGFLSKAHIEQTASAQEGVAQISQIETELARQTEVITQAEQRIKEAQNSATENNANIQSQIDAEQARIDNAYARIQPAIDEQTKIIEDARAADTNRTKPFELQLENLELELRRIEEQAVQFENRISELSADTSSIEPLLTQIESIENSISLVQGQLSSGERAAIQNAQRTIGVDTDGAAGPNTRRAADAWIAQQQNRIAELQTQVSNLRFSAQQTVDAERTRLAGIVADLRGTRLQSIKDRKLEILTTIDSIRSTESPVIQSARDEIVRLQQTADAQIARSQELITRFQNSLTIGNNEEADRIIELEKQKIFEANTAIDRLTQEKYQLQAEYRKLEAEVGPIKYLAEVIYSDTDRNTLEDAVRWVIMIIIFVFDPLAVALLIAAQYIFEWRKEDRQKQNKDKEQALPETVTSADVIEIKEPEPKSPRKKKSKPKNPLSEIIPIEADDKDKIVDNKTYDPYTDTRQDNELTKEELTARNEIWPAGYDGKLAPPAPFKR